MPLVHAALTCLLFMIIYLSGKFCVFSKIKEEKTCKEEVGSGPIVTEKIGLRFTMAAVDRSFINKSFNLVRHKSITLLSASEWMRAST